MKALIFRSIFLTALSVSALNLQQASAQNLIGSPLIKNYSPVDYGSRPRNWALEQDEDGILYVGNDMNLLTFDGNHWRSIPINNTIVRTITKDPAGKIYVGAQGDFGYLTRNEIGDLKYNSMLTILDSADRRFTDVWSLHADGIYLFVQTSFKLFRIRIADQKVASWTMESSYHRSFLINNILYLIPAGVGLQKLNGDKLELVPGGEQFKDHQLSMMIPMSDGKILMGTQRNGLVIFNPSGKTPYQCFRPFKNDAESYLLKEGIFSALKLPSGDIAIGCLSGGVIILSPEGKLLMQTDENSGLQSNMSLQLLLDRYGNLVVGNNGVSIIEYNSPIRIFNRGNGLSGIILSSLWLNNIFYVGSAEGLFYYNNEERRFRKIPGVLTQCWSLAAYGPPGNKSLIVSSTFGFYEVKGTSAQTIRSGNFFNLIPHPNNPDLIFSGQENSVMAMQKVNGRWQSKSIAVPGYTDLWTGNVDDDENLWFGTDVFGLLRIPILDKGSTISELPDKFLPEEIFSYGTNAGLPSNFRTYTFTLNGKLYAPSEDGVYIFNQTFNRFEKDTAVFKSLIGRRTFQLASDKKGRIWFDSRKGKGWIEKRNNKWVIEETALKRIPPTPGFTGHSSAIYCDPNGITWFGNSEGLFQFNSENISTSKSAQPLVLLREVTWNDSVLYKGHGTFKSKDLKPGKNAINFSFSSPFTSGIDNNKFSFRLTGFNNDWSEWSTGCEQQFLNLPFGDYTFEVKSINLTGEESAVTSYPFTIRKPWYLAWWMWIVYLGSSASAVFYVLRWRDEASKNEKQELESIIRQRTKEAQDQNKKLMQSQQELLSRQNDLEQQKAELTLTKKKIEQYNEQLESAVEERTRVLADQNQQLEQFSFVTAHNLRSPVARVMALVNLLQSDLGSGQGKAEILKKLSQSALDLDTIIKDLGTILELRKGHQIKFEEVSLRNMVDLILRSFEELLTRSDIKVKADIEVDYMVTFPAYLNSILYNLISNSIKYRAPDRIAVISLRVFKKDKMIHFIEEDNGIGFDSEKFGSRVFEPFQRLTTIKEGKGLGMFLVKSQIEALGGTVNLTSTPGIGTRVEFSLPSHPIGTV